MNFLVALLLTQTPLQAKITELDPKTPPTLGIHEFRNRKPITVSEYVTVDKGKSYHIFVYRYCYKAKYEPEAKLWKELYVKSRGWKIDHERPKELLISHRAAHPKLVDQALILHPGRIAFDKKQKARTRVIPDDNWVWVSLNETHKK